jgi:serine/threonine protein kinase
MRHSCALTVRDALSAEERLELERLCDRFEDACGRGEAVNPAAVLAEAPPPVRPALARELLQIELAYRPADRRDAIVADYLGRFPEHAAPLGDAADAGTDPAGTDTDATCHRPPDAPPLPAVIGGYRVRGELGRGGMGVVYAAEDPALGRTVAIKTLTPALATNPTARDYFLREARAAAAVEHDHVVPVYHVGEDTVGPYLVMPVLSGETLADRLKSGPLSVPELLRVGREVALGLAAAHAAGLVHRDVKPGNIWLDADRGGRARVLDFGLARAIDGADTLTRTGNLRGTPRYMSPEQAKGNPVDPRTDLFALGATLFHAATGRPPFAGTTQAAVLDAVIHKDPPPAHERNPVVPPAVSALLTRLMAKEPCDRPESADAVAGEIATLAATLDRLPTAPPRTPVPPFPRWWLTGGGIALTLIVTVGVLWAAFVSPRPSAPTVPTPTAPPTELEPSGPSLLVKEIDVRPHNPLGGGGFDPLPLLGRDNPSATTVQAITVKVTLSRPAYSYIVLFRADGQEDLLDPRADTDIPVKTDSPKYPPPPVRDTLYQLDDGPGLWAVGVVASDDPLPTYREWRARHPGGPWKANPTPPKVVVFDDGQWVQTFAPGQGATRGSRGEVIGADRKAVVALVNWLKQQGGTAAAIAFPVTEAK